MIESAAELLRVKGLSAMSFTDITEASGAPRGVIYHHFPDGKSEVARDAVAWTATAVAGQLAALDANTPVELVDRYLHAIRTVMNDSTQGASCAVAAVTVESLPTSGELAGTAARAFESWIGVLRDKFIALGVRRRMADDLATLLVAVLQGSHILARASGNLRQFDRTARATRAAAAALLDAGGSATH